MQQRSKKNSLEFKLGRTHKGKSKGMTSKGRPVITEKKSSPTSTQWDALDALHDR